MTFPVQFHVFGQPILAHTVFEVIAYAGGFQIFLMLRRRQPRADVPFEKLMWIWVGCVFGALAGAKLLAWAESPIEYWNARHDAAAWLGGKTIVGGLLGGWAGVEIAKRAVGVNKSTGDLFVFPLIFGIAVGRIGCFLTGLTDHTHGVHTSLPWAVDFGDGPRHPTQLYEIAFLICLAIALAIRQRSLDPSTRAGPSRPGPARHGPALKGELFRLFMIGYLLFRFGVEFIKPTFKPWLGMSAIQLATMIGVITAYISLRSMAVSAMPAPATEQL